MTCECCRQGNNSCLIKLIAFGSMAVCWDCVVNYADLRWPEKSKKIKRLDIAKTSYEDWSKWMRMDELYQDIFDRLMTNRRRTVADGGE